LVASYDLRPENGTGLFWKKKIDKSGSKQVREESIRKEVNETNNLHSAEINK